MASPLTVYAFLKRNRNEGYVMIALRRTRALTVTKSAQLV